MSNNNKIAFILASQGFEARYLLNTDLQQELLALGYDIVILSPSAREKEFIHDYKSERVNLEYLDIKACNDYYKNNKLARALARIRNYVLAGGSSHFTPLDDKMQSGHARGKPEKKYKRLVFDILVSTLRSSRSARKLLLAAESLFVKPKTHRELFNKYKPKVLIIAGIGFRPADTCLGKEAISYGVKVVSVIYGWDKACSQGYRGIEPDGVVVWGESMHKEVCHFQDILPDRVLAAGNLYFDKYRDSQIEINKESFCRKYGLDHKKKTILFATKSPNSYPNYLVVEILAKIIYEYLIDEAQLLVRLHPIHLNQEFQESEFGRHLSCIYKAIEEKYNFVKFYLPKKNNSTRTRMLMDNSERDSIANQLVFSDVVVTPFSTIMLESIYYKRPVININFDIADDCNMRSFRSISIDARQIHLQRIVRSEGLIVSNSTDDLARQLKDIIKKEVIELSGMKRVLFLECGELDGNVATRIASFVVKIANA